MYNPRQMAEWKRPLFIGIGWGLGTALGLVVLVGGFLWYQSRPKPLQPPKPWNTGAIKADYRSTSTEGDKNSVVFSYTLENTTDFDYQVEGGGNVRVSATLDGQNTLAPFEKFVTIDYPIFVPAKKRVVFQIHFEHRSAIKEKEHSNDADTIKHHEAVEKEIADIFNNLDGFDLLDETNRYEIIFPAGWKHAKK
jgi:hypothetical protein